MLTVYVSDVMSCDADSVCFRGHPGACTGSTSDTYRAIKTCLTSLLLHAGKHVAMATTKTMQSLVQGSNGTVWEHLLRDTADCRLPM